MENILKKVDGDWKKRVVWRLHRLMPNKELYWFMLSPWWRHKLETLSTFLALYHANRIVHSFYIMQWSAAYTVACTCINVTDSDYVMDNGMAWAWMTSLSMRTWQIYISIKLRASIFAKSTYTVMGRYSVKSSDNWQNHGLITWNTVTIDDAAIRIDCYEAI